MRAQANLVEASEAPDISIVGTFSIEEIQSVIRSLSQLNFSTTIDASHMVKSGISSLPLFSTADI